MNVLLTILHEGSEIVTVSLPDTRDPMIGREVSTNEVVLHNRTVSRIHARLLFRQGVVYLSDLRSSSGTFVNDERIRTQTKLAAGDVIAIGDVICRVDFDQGKADEEPMETLRGVRCVNRECLALIPLGSCYCPQCGTEVGV